MDSENRRQGHGRTASLLQTLGALTRTAGDSSGVVSSGKKATYGSKKKQTHRSVLIQSHVDQQLWDTASVTTNDKRRPISSNSLYVTESARNNLGGLEGLGTGLGIDFPARDGSELNKENVTLDEYKTLDPDATTTTTSTSRSTLSRMARALSTLSNASSASSKATVDLSTARTKRASKCSSVSTVHRLSALSVCSDFNDDAIVAAAAAAATDTSSSSLRRSTAVSANLNGILQDNESSSLDDLEGASGRHAVEILAAASSTPVVEQFAIPYARSGSSSSPASGTPSDIHQPTIFRDSPPSLLGSSGRPSTSTDERSFFTASPSASSILSFKRDHTKAAHKKVEKAAISLPTGLVDPSAHFVASSPKISANSSYLSESQSRPSHKKSTSSFFSSGFLSLRGHKSRDEMRNIPAASGCNGHARKLSVNLANTFSKKTSISDMRKSILAFSPSSSSLLSRIGSPSESGSGESAFDKSMISLPVPVEESREKLRNKLRASASLLSLTPSEASATTGLTVGIPVEEYAQSRMERLLQLCSFKEVMDFDEFLASISTTNEMRKLAEASFSEVFIQDDPVTGSSKIYKIIPFGEEELDQLPVQDIIQELTIARLLMEQPGFVKVLGSVVVQGKFPQPLLDKWDEYASNNNNSSENYRPDSYDRNQRYCIIVLANGGTDLEHYDVDTWQEASSIFWQVVKHLAVAEQKFEFEHRDLHWGNILISTNAAHQRKSVDGGLDEALNSLSIEDDIKVTLIDYTLSRATSPGGTIVCTRLDHPDFFRGKGDYQFDIYRFMRNHVSSLPSHNAATPSALYTHQSGSSTTVSSQIQQDKVTNWSLFCPKTNVLWLHYVVDKLLYSKDLQKVSATRRGRLSFGGGSNTSLRDAFANGTLDANEEATACQNLEIVHRSLDPRKKRFGKRRGGEMYFQDFSSASDVLSWGVKAKMVSI